MSVDSKQKYSLLDKLNLCHRCEKARPAPGRKYCFDCLDKIREYNEKKYDPLKAQEYQSRRRELYEQKKQKGICVKCSKPATHGLYCYECSIKAKKHNIKTAERRKAERHDRGLIPETRREQHLCLRCGEPLDTEKSQFCQKCSEQCGEFSRRADHSGWRKIEAERYEKGRRWRKKYDKN